MMQTPSTAPPSKLKDQVKRALDRWHKANDGKSSLDHLYLFRKLMRETQQNHRRVTNEVLNRCLQRLEREQGEHAAYLKERYLDDQTAIQLAKKRNVGEATVFNKLRDAREQLTVILWDLERENRRKQKIRLIKRLEPPTYVQLIGIDAQQEKVLEKLMSPDEYYIVSITGIGGLGKTSLADSMVRRVIEEGQFDEIGWVTAKQQQLNLMARIEDISPAAQSAEGVVRELCRQLMPNFPLPTNFVLKDAVDALEVHLNQYPHLIVIDNLETIEDVRDLFPTLRRLANPSKFLLTSREPLYGELNICHCSIPALSQDDSLRLLRHEAKQSNLPVVAESMDEELYPIYQTVGGNPLALKLVVGLAHHEDLDEILSDLKGAHNPTADQVYTYIYRQAWDKLSALGKKVLVTMPAVKSRGGSLDQVVSASGLSKRDVRSGLSSLVILNLVNVHGEQHERRYSIHSLTRSFLLEQVLLWTQTDDSIENNIKN